MNDTETAYLMVRAKQEAIAAIKADNPSAAAAHHQLSVLYSAKALLELGEEVDSGQKEDKPARQHAGR